MSSNTNDLHEIFIRYHSRYQDKIFAVILAMCPDWHDAQEIMQETSLVLWRKFPEFQIGTDYKKWGSAIARFEVMKFREREKKGSRLFSDETLFRLEEKMNQRDEFADDRHVALRSCLGKLPSKDRALVIARYFTGVPIRDVAADLGRTVESVCNSLRRVRSELLECVRHELSR